MEMSKILRYARLPAFICAAFLFFFLIPSVTKAEDVCWCSNGLGCTDIGADSCADCEQACKDKGLYKAFCDADNHLHDPRCKNKPVCWCLGASGTCGEEKNVKSEAECDAACAKMDNGTAIHYDVTGTDYSQTDECQKGNKEVCWCKDDKGICKQAGDYTCDPQNEISCETFCKNSGGTVGQCDKSGKAPACAAEPAVPATPSTPTPAQTGSPAQLYNPLGKITSVQDLIGRAIRAVLGIVGALALLMFVYGGFVWLTSGGSEKRIEQGKHILVNATVGLLIIFFSYTLINLFFGAVTSSTATSFAPVFFSFL